MCATVCPSQALFYGTAAEIERLAAAELRSANAQVEYLLRDALKARSIKVRAATPTEGRGPRG